MTAICPWTTGVLVAGRFTTPQNLYGRQMLTFLRLTPEGRWDDVWTAVTCGRHGEESLVHRLIIW